MRTCSRLKRHEGYSRILVRPLTGALGAEICGVDLMRPMDAELELEIKRAFTENLVIYFHDQKGFTREHHLEFAQRFGKLQKIPHIFSVDGYPDVQIVERLVDDTRRVIGEAFHNDSTYMATPPTTVTMHAVNVPEYGGDTAFANLYLAYETLSEPMRALLDNMQCAHSAALIFGRDADQKSVMMKEMDVDEGEHEVIHPLVCVHPVSKRKYLFFNLVYTRRIVGFSEKESRMFLEFLQQHVGNLAFTGRVRWKNGTVLIWDNRCVQHSAIGDYQGQYRYLERVTTGGEVPTGQQPG